MQYGYKNVSCKPTPSQEAWRHLASEIYGSDCTESQPNGHH